MRSLLIIMASLFLVACSDYQRARSAYEGGDYKKAFELFKKLSESGDTRSEYDLSFLGQIPLVQSIREGGDEGVPAMVGSDTVSKDAFRTFVGNAVRQIAIRNANLPQTATITVAP